RAPGNAHDAFGCARDAGRGLTGLALPGLRLQDADLIAERVAQAAVDPVAVIDRLLRELDALGAEPLVRAEAVVGAEHHGDPGRALRDELPDLLGGLLV